MTTRTFSPRAFVLVATALLCVPTAHADPPTVTPAIEKAFTQLEQGPDQLRRFVQRTRMIYELDYAGVVAAYKAKYGVYPPAWATTSADARTTAAATQTERR